MSRVSVTPFLRGRWYWARVPRLGLTAVHCPLGTADKDKALAICAFILLMRDRRESFLLDAFVDRKATIGAAFDAFNANRLADFIRDLREGREDEDLAPYVAKWQAEMARVRRPNAESRAKYLKQVRTLIPEGKVFRRSALTKKAIRDWLAGMGVSSNRYRAALSSFASYLVGEEILPFNPVLQVKAAREAEPRCRYLDQDEAQRVVNAITDPMWRAYHALAAATAMERQALFRLTRRDIDVEARTVLARGSKKPHRARTSHAYTRWNWAWDIFAGWLKGAALLPDTRVFGHRPEHLLDRRMRRALDDACVNAEISDYRPHDWRHTWAVQGLRDGLAIQTVSHQLGHRDAVMTLRVYGRFIPTAADFSTDKVTRSVTSPQKTATN